MSLYDDYEKQVEKATKDFQDRAQKIHDDAMCKIDEEARAMMMKFLMVMGGLSVILGIAALAFKALGLFNPS